MDWTDSDWETAIETKVKEIQADSRPVIQNLWTDDGEIQTDKLAATIDHTLLKPNATPAQLDALCAEALRFRFKSCCVNGVNIPRVAERLKGSPTIPCAVIGFPLGACSTDVKAFETQDVIKHGAKEVDMVINIGAVNAKQYTLVYGDIRRVVEAASPVPLKVIIETTFLTDQEKIAASYIATEAGAAFVKTCTGFSGGGATEEDVLLMKKTVGYKPGVQVKASAGIRSFEKCLEMLRAGADRIGTSSGCAIMEKTVGSGY